MKAPLSSRKRIAQMIGPGVGAPGFRVILEGGAVQLTPEECNLQIAVDRDDETIFIGHQQGVTVRWRFAPWRGGVWVTLDVSAEHPLGCVAIESLILDYQPGGAVGEWRVPAFGESEINVHHVGLFRVHDFATEQPPDSAISGAFRDGTTPGLFLGTQLPQRFRHLYAVSAPDAERVTFCAATYFPEGPRQVTALTSEATWVCGTLGLRAALESYASHVPTTKAPQTPPTGWNTWDYYFRSGSLDDLIENMDALGHEPEPAERLRYMVVDDGWQHNDGEWQPNYRWPGGLERTVEEIRRRGYTPGIWTAPVLVQTLSLPASRAPEMLVKDRWGDPQPGAVTERYTLDPTHPAAQVFLRELYTRLYRIGFRLFKVDYVSELLAVERFYDSTAGPYDALRTLFALIRECVTEESHIIGCSLPAECGPGIVDSGRLGIDIHNHWAHVEWVADYLQLRYWLHNRIWINDPDFLVVRGLDTSTEAETNVTNPAAHRPHPPRWRRGPVFTLDEAKTWATLVALTGGSVFLSDRIATLNEAGLALLRAMPAPAGVAARPLDLGDTDRAALWLQELDGRYRLGIINWSDGAKSIRFDFAGHGLDAPKQVRDVWTGEARPVAGSAAEAVLGATCRPRCGSGIFDSGNRHVESEDKVIEQRILDAIIEELKTKQCLPRCGAVLGVSQHRAGAGDAKCG